MLKVRNDLIRSIAVAAALVLIPALFLSGCASPESTSERAASAKGISEPKEKASAGADFHKSDSRYEEAKEAALSALSKRMSEESGGVNGDYGMGSSEEDNGGPVMLRSYDTDNVYIENVAFSYDNALAAMAFLSEGRQQEAKRILDAFVLAVRNDRSGNKRVRNAYAAGEVMTSEGKESQVRLPGWYDNKAAQWIEDRYQVGSNVGNTSYTALALMQYYGKYGGEDYLETARTLMDWVIENCEDEGDGFIGGFDGWEEANPPVVYPLTYKSTEHNIDAWAVFTALYEATSENKYSDAAQSAENFIKSMYNKKQGLFMTGTQEDGITPNTSVVALDAQVWCAMALGDAFEPYSAALKTVEKMRTKEGGYSFCLENRNGGWWAEGTAYTALMYRLRGDEAKYRTAMDALVSVQKDSGLFPAATDEHLSTGIDLFDGSPWEYSTDPHIAPTAWFVMASNGFNPYVIADAE